MIHYDDEALAALLASGSRYAVCRCYSDGGALLYIGVADQPGFWFALHALQPWFIQVRGISLEWHADQSEAKDAAQRAIHVEHPKYNMPRWSTDRPDTTQLARRPAPAPPRFARDVPPEQRVLILISQAHAAEMQAQRPLSAREMQKELGVSTSLTCQVLRILRSSDTAAGSVSQ